MSTVLLSELFARGVRLEPGEALAITQQLIRARGVPLSAGDVGLRDDGSVVCAGCNATPGVYELAIFLQSLVPLDAFQVRGGLRYTIARGLHEVEARPFDSVEEFSAALQRFEEGNRGAIVRNLVNRVPRRAARARSVRPFAAAAAAIAIVALGSVLALRSMKPRSIDVRPPASTSARATPPQNTVEPSRIPLGIPTAHERRPSTRRQPPTVVVTTQPAREGGIVSAVDAHRKPIFSPAFASNGTALFFHAGGSRDARSVLAVADDSTSGHDLEVMTILDDGARNYHVRPSPDGRLVAFDSDREGDRAVYVAQRDGSEVRRISGSGYAAVPTWSPDAQRLAYVRAEPDDPRVWNLWLHRLGDAQATRITNYRYGQTWAASWFPDNRRVAYAHEDRLVVLELETGRTQIYVSPVKGRLIRTPAVSPDGTRVIFQVFRDGAWMLGLADGSLRRVLSDPTAEEFAWSPDGRRVAFHSRRDGQWGIYVIAA